MIFTDRHGAGASPGRLGTSQCCCCCCPGSWAITAGASHFPLLFLPSPIFLLPLSCSPFSRVLLTVQLSSLRSCGLLTSLMANTQPRCSGLCFYSELCGVTWACPRLAVPGAGASQGGHTRSAWPVLGVTRAQHPAADTTVISPRPSQLPDGTAGRTPHYFLLFPAVKIGYLSFPSPWFDFAESLHCPTGYKILGTQHTPPVHPCLERARAVPPSAGGFQAPGLSRLSAAKAACTPRQGMARLYHLLRWVLPCARSALCPAATLPSPLVIISVVGF